MKLPHHLDESGFTIVEVVVTLIVVALFVTAFFQSYLLLESQRVDVARQAKASDIAYSNLRKVSVRPSSLTCDDSMDLTTGNPSTKEKTGGANLTNYGYVLDPAEIAVLGTSKGQTLKAFAPNGCANFASSPIKIISTVTYGDNREVTHAGFVQ